MTSEFYDPALDMSRREKIGSIFVRRESDIVRVRDRVRLTARELGFDNVTQIKLTTAISELTRNIYEYAHAGTITVSLIERDGRSGMEIVCEDQGPGIESLDKVLAGEFQSSTGLGKGLTGSRRLMDEFHIASSPERGTRVQVIKWFAPDQRPLESMEDVRQHFFSASESGMVEELQSQNQELVGVLGELTMSRHEIEQTNRELQRANEQLKHIDEIKSQFISTIAHEVRTPLNAILGLVQVLLRDKAEPLTPRQHDTVMRLEKSTSMLVRLVNDLLDLSRLQAGRMQIRVESFAPAELIDSIYTGLNQTASDKCVTFEYEVEPSLRFVTSDATKVAQVITNLASNALKFTPAGGSVNVKAGPDGEYMWYVEVRDTGIGMEEEQVPVIFEEFRQINVASPHHTGGTGLGLPISKRLVELLGGRIKVASAPSHGSTFTVIWPRDVRRYVAEAVIADS